MANTMTTNSPGASGQYKPYFAKGTPFKKKTRYPSLLPASHKKAGTQPTPDQYLAKGGTVKGKMHINPANKGKFTALQKKTGKSTAELKSSPNPLTRKRANFAMMAKRHFKPLPK